jgi:flagellum-specific ATP synthase
LTVESSGPKVGIGELCGINIRNGKCVWAEVVGFNDDRLVLLPLEHIEGISPGDTVTSKTAPRYMTISDNILGRVLNGLGEPIDGRGPLVGDDKCALDAASPPALSRKKIEEPLSLGIRSIDGMLTIGKGTYWNFRRQRCGKRYAGRYCQFQHADVNVVALIGERT